MSDIYYVGDAVDLAYRVVESPNPLHKIIALTVSVFSDEGEIIHDDPTTIVDDMVKYTISPTMTTHRGNYVALFTHWFSHGQVKTHPIMFSVLPRGIPKEAEGTPVIDLNEESTDDEVEGAVSRTLRMLRRQGIESSVSVAITYSTAEEKIQRRIPK